ncbi:MAG: ClpXP protease specificity-enhancing factor SspB [Rhodospirillaceae bacterium]|nr:ClpXP protease specificity-enhancing factor SspB [Rhodospirillaceae bacterium]
MTDENVKSLIYERMVEDALRGVLRQALEITQEQGLPGSHHFYVTFDTTHDGVRMADSLRAMHPSEMTIVLQHQFWDLNVDEEFFGITLSFSGTSQRLHVPFAAVTAFADPHAKFGLQFHVEFEEEDESEYDKNGDEFTDDEDYEMPPIDNVVVTQHSPWLKTERRARNDSSEETEPDPEEETGKVVTLDAFRKK